MKWVLILLFYNSFEPQIIRGYDTETICEQAGDLLASKASVQKQISGAGPTDNSWMVLDKPAKGVEKFMCVQGQ